MLLRTLGLTAVTLLSSFSVDAAYSSSGPNVLYYWGQNSAGGAGTQASLASYCSSGKADGIILSFLNVFNVGGLPGLNFAGACTTTFPGLSLLSCPTIGNDIKVCQGLGVKVILSLGGAAGSYSLSGDAAAQTFAQTLWDLFGGGSSPNRPFGSSTIDGIDLDIEGGPSTGYVALVNAAKAKFGSGFLVGAAPQCPFPDQILGSVIDAVGVDYVNVQFYNNYCSAAGGSFNFDTWARWAAGAPNRNVKVMLTLPGSTTAAGSGYVPISTISSIVPTLASNYPGIYGGVSIWDASQAWNNGDFANSLYSLVKGNAGNPAPNPNPNPTTTTKATTTTTSPSGPTGLPASGSCIKQGQSCTGGGRYACTSNGAYAICNQGTWSVQGCPAGTVCIATDDKSSIYCGFATPGSNTCSVSAVSLLRESLTNGPVPKPYKSSQVSAELTIVSSHTKKFEAVINARRLNNMPFKKQVIIEFTAPENIKFTSASNGTVRQVGNKVRIVVANKYADSMSLVVGLKGSVKKGVFVAFSPSTLRFK